jgi:hypothetical protein
LGYTSEGFIDDLGIGQAVEVCLPADRINPTAFDMEGGAFGFTGRIACFLKGSLTLLPPDDDLLKVIHHRDKHIFVYIRYTLGGLSIYIRYIFSILRVYVRCTLGGLRTRAVCGRRRRRCRRDRQFKLLEVIPDGRAGETEPLGDLILGEAFNNEATELDIINLGGGHRRFSVVEVSNSHEYTRCIHNQWC